MARIGTKKIQHNGNKIKIPIFEPSDLDTPFFRTKVDGKTGAIPFKPLSDNPELDFLRTHHNGTTRALHHSTITRKGVIDDFEDNDLSEYKGDISVASIKSTSPVKHNTYALEFIGDDNSPYQITSLSGLPRYPQAGDTFETWVYIDVASDSKSNINFGSFDGTYTDYSIQLIAYNQDFKLFYPGGSVADSYTFSDSTWYRVVVDWGESGNITCTLYDESGNQQAQVSTTDSTSTGGAFGFAFDSAGSTTPFTRFDRARIISTTSGTGVIDDFEDGNTTEYVEDIGNDLVISADATAAYKGSYGLLLDSTGDYTNGSITSMTGLDRYPQKGDTFEWRGYHTESYNLSSVHFGLQSHEQNNKYHVRAYGENSALEMYKTSGGSTTNLFSETLTVPTNSWFRIKVDWGKDGSFTVTMYDDTDSLLATGTATDTEFEGGGIGFSGSTTNAASGDMYFDNLKITSSGDQAVERIVDGFEDGDMSEWSLYNSPTGSYFEASNSVSANGDWSGHLLVDSSNNIIVTRSAETSDASPSSMQAYLRQENMSSTNNTELFWRADGRSGDRVITINLRLGDVGLEVNGTNIIGSSEIDFDNGQGDWFFVEMNNINWSNYTVGTVYVERLSTGDTWQKTDVAFVSNRSFFDTVELNANGSETYDSYYDDVTIG